MNEAQRIKEMEAIIENLCKQIEELKYKNELLVNRLEVITGKKACVACDRPHDCWHNGCNKNRKDKESE